MEIVEPVEIIIDNKKKLLIERPAKRKLLETEECSEIVEIYTSPEQ